MDRLNYFIGKLWTFISTFHPLAFATIIIVSGLVFFIIKRTIQKYKPQSKDVNLLAIVLTIFVGLPILGLILYFILGELFKNQQF